MNRQDDRVKCSLIKFSVKKLWRLDDTPKGSPAYQKNIIKLEEQASRNIIKFINKMQNIGLTSSTAVSQIGK